MKLEQQLKQLSFSGLAAALLLIVVPETAFARHIMEGFLPPMWALAWWLLFLPCLWYGLVRLRRIVQEDNNQKVLLALCGAFIFVLSALKIPSVTGSCSHPTGTGAFKFGGYNDAAGEVTLERNDDYWGNKAGVAYRLKDGSMVYVPEAGVDQTAPGTQAEAAQ